MRIPGIQEDALEWLDKLAPPSWRPPADGTKKRSCPPEATTATIATGRTTATPISRTCLVHHQVIVPVTKGRLDSGPWQAILYCEFDGRRSKRLIIKVMGE